MSTQDSSADTKLWGGRFAESTDKLVEQFSESVSYDRRLYKHDIAGSIAHAWMLAKVGVLTRIEASQIDHAERRRIDDIDGDVPAAVNRVARWTALKVTVTDRRRGGSAIVNFIR